MNISKIIPFLSLLLITSCASAKFEGRGVMTGRVCDKKGRPVAGYHISAGLGKEALSDSGGIFVFKNLPSGNYSIKGGGFGWSESHVDFFFHDRREIICIQVESLEDILPEIEERLKEGDYEGAKESLFRAKDYNEKHPLFLCYKRLIDYCKSPSERGKKKLLSTLELL
ncbi:MAG: carboxypeptidase-like regulatory domain-containing protein [Treponema sp.]|nr:carboxypeptidase-like regulatory domain-containing protein [Treponema sp.]